MAIYELYFSPTGGTKKVMDILAGVWEDVKTMDLKDPACDGVAFQAGDLCLVGIPVFGGRVPQVVTDRLKTMTSNGASAVPVAVYGARAYDDALVELTDILTDLGFVCGGAVAAVAQHSVMPAYGAGRPDADDAAVLTVFAQQLKERFEAGQLTGTVSVPGNRPYVKMAGMPIHPSGSKKCIQCGQCAQVCPMGAISGPDFSKTDGKKCITCMACVSACPTHARDFNGLLLKTVQVAMASAFKGEHHNELFLAQ